MVSVEYEREFLFSVALREFPQAVLWEFRSFVESLLFVVLPSVFPLSASLLSAFLPLVLF